MTTNEHTFRKCLLSCPLQGPLICTELYTKIQLNFTVFTWLKFTSAAFLCSSDALCCPGVRVSLSAVHPMSGTEKKGGTGSGTPLPLAAFETSNCCVRSPAPRSKGDPVERPWRQALSTIPISSGTASGQWIKHPLRGTQARFRLDANP